MKSILERLASSPKPMKPDRSHVEDTGAAYSVKSRTATWILGSITCWNVLVLVLAIIVATEQGKPKWEVPSVVRYQAEFEHTPLQYHRITGRLRAGVVFLWCTPPFVNSAVAAVDLARRQNMTGRHVILSAGIGAALYLFAFLLWGDCAYLSEYKQGLWPVCYHEPSWDWFSGNPIALIFVLPWFALATAITYASIMAFALFAVRRQRKNTVQAAKSTAWEFGEEMPATRSSDQYELGKPSNEYTEMAPSSVGEETLFPQPAVLATDKTLEKM